MLENLHKYAKLSLYKYNKIGFVYFLLKIFILFLLRMTLENHKQTFKVIKIYNPNWILLFYCL